MAEVDCVEITSFQTIINNFFEGNELEITEMGREYKPLKL